MGVETLMTELRRNVGARTVSGEFGAMRGSLEGTATGFKRSMSGLGASAERRALEKTLLEVGVGIASRLVRGEGSPSEVTDEFVDVDPEYSDSEEVSGSKMEPSPRLYLDFGFVVGSEREMGARAELSISIKCGVVPRRAPSFLVERMRRLRCWPSRLLQVGGRLAYVDGFMLW